MWLGHDFAWASVVGNALVIIFVFGFLVFWLRARRMPSRKKLSARRTQQRESRKRRVALEGSVRTHLVPALLQMGFAVAAPFPFREPVDPDFPASFPDWGQFVRDRGAVLDEVDIQFASYDRAAFRINARSVPKKSAATAAGSAELYERFETHARPWLRPALRALRVEPLGAWFSLWRLPFGSPTPADYDKLVLRAVQILPELELALREKKLGPHMQSFKMQPFPPEVQERVNERINKLKAEGKWTTNS
jgi:hypothetical protein